MASYQVAAKKDPMASTFEAAGLAGRGFIAMYRPVGGEWKACREDRGAEGMVMLWRETPAAAIAAAKTWLQKRSKRKARMAGTA